MRALSKAVAIAAAIGWAAMFPVQLPAQQQARPGFQAPPGFPAKMADPPATLPDDCPETMVQGLKTVAATAAYRSVHREIAALRVGHQASQKLQAALVLGGQTGTDTSTEHQLIQVMTGMDTAQNLYLCGSFIAGQDGGDPGMDQELRTQFVPVFNRMALASWRLENSVVMRTADSGANGGDSVAEILDERNRAAEDLVQAVATSEGRLLDGDSLRVTCAERARLLGELATLHAGPEGDESSRAAGLLSDFLKKQTRCVAT